MKKVLFIINRKSGTGRKIKFPSQADSILDKKKLDYDIAYTQYRGHAIEIAKKAAIDGIDIVAAVGGDGSVNEVAQGILGTRSVLAIIPEGSGNGLARALRIPMNASKALKLIHDGKVRQMDTGVANGRLFLSNAGVGFDARIAKLFSENKRRGFISYARLVVQEFRKYQPGFYDICIEEKQIQASAFFIVAANGNQFGYNFKIAPDARMDDGLLDICVMKPLRADQLPGLSVRLFLGKPNSKFATRYRCRSLTISSAKGLEWMQIDGDALPVENNKMEISLHPEKLKVICT